MKERGFTLVELLATIIILSVIAIIITPVVMGTINDAKQKAFLEDANAIIEATKNYATKQEMMTNVPFTNQLVDVTSAILEYNGDRAGFVGQVFVDENGKIAIEMNNGVYCATKGINDDTVSVVQKQSAACDGSALLDQYGTEYTEAILKGTDPVLEDGMIAVSIAADGTVTRASTKSAWYSYANKQWANVVTLVDDTNYSVGDTIPANKIKAYFVWIPKYSYKIFNLGWYNNVIESAPGSSLAQEIQIKFGTTNTTDTAGECATPMTSSASGNCKVGDYMTHPAFKSLNVNGFWVGKFETTGSLSDMTVLPNVLSIVNQTVGAMFTAAKSYNTSWNSHMMKNTEWGAVAYLSHSTYGINGEIRIDNCSYTGYAAAEGTNQSTYPGESGDSANLTQPYNTVTGVKASTTGNITGVYDMNGGRYEYVAALMDGNYNTGTSGVDATMVNNNPTYFDIYSVGDWLDPSRRILGDATTEMGPFYYYEGRVYSSWYNDESPYVNGWNPYFIRGGFLSGGSLSGQLSFYHSPGYADSSRTFRLVLAPDAN